jgi:crotonobetainyl-CoA:carnitine CoA-transferase CaiB-like acyl-CoA transferase
MLIEMDHSKLGKVRQIGMPIKLSETPGQVRTIEIPPRAKTDEILSHFGYTRKEIKPLVSTGAVGLEPAGYCSKVVANF